jgi:hypothetical protein
MANLSFARDKSSDIEVANKGLQSNIYAATIKHILFNRATTGAVGFDYTFIINGEEYTSYGNYVYNKEGKKIEFAYAIWDSLLHIFGLEDVKPKKGIYKIRKKDTTELVDRFGVQELEGKKVYVYLQNAYARYNGSITRKYAINRFYRFSDKATSSEISATDKGDLDEPIIGNQYTQDIKKPYNRYEKGLSALEVEEFYAAKKTGTPPVDKKRPSFNLEDEPVEAQKEALNPNRNESLGSNEEVDIGDDEIPF